MISLPTSKEGTEKDPSGLDSLKFEEEDKFCGESFESFRPRMEMMISEVTLEMRPRKVWERSLPWLGCGQ